METLKTLTLGMALTVASALQASCPALSGDYACPDTGKITYLGFSQSITNGFISYAITTHNGTMRFITDGVYRSAGPYTLNAYCEDNALKIHAVNDSWNMHMSYYLDENHQLNIHEESAEIFAGVMTEVRDSTCEMIYRTP